MVKLAPHMLMVLWKKLIYMFLEDMFSGAFLPPLSHVAMGNFSSE